MKIATWARVVAPAGAVGGLVVLIACSSSSLPPAPPSESTSQCSTSPGEFPVPNCVNYPPDAQQCVPPVVACPTAPCMASSSCLAMATNSGTTASLRIRKLNVAAPAVLAEHFTQAAVIDQGINLQDQCGEGGDGTFNWLIQVDTANNQLTTGGAPPTSDPFNTGYCFVNTTIEGLKVAPITTTVTKNTDGSFSTGVIPKLYVPIYVAAAAGQQEKVIVLPLSNTQVKNVTLSENNNCIGAFNPDGVVSDGGATCMDTSDDCPRWTTAGSLAGYITLNEADGVDVPQLQRSLCAFLTSGMGGTVTNDAGQALCARNASGKIIATGDYCSTTGKAGGCADSFWLAATFAASAAKIVPANQPACMGQSPTGDAGAGGDATAPTDASGQ